MSENGKLLIWMLIVIWNIYTFIKYKWDKYD